MINGMQFIIHLPTLNVNMPGNAFLIITQIILVATFDIPYATLEKIPNLYKVDETEILTENPPNLVNQLDILGYNSAFLSTTMGSGYLILIATIIGLIIIVLTLPFRRFNWCTKVNDWL